MIPLLTNSLFFDCLNTKLSKSLETILHGFELFEGVSLPIHDFAYNTKRILRAVRKRRVTRVLLVSQIGVVFKRASRLHHIDPAGALTKGELGSPDSCIQSAGQINVGRLLPLTVVRIVA